MVAICSLSWNSARVTWYEEMYKKAGYQRENVRTLQLLKRYRYEAAVFNHATDTPTLGTTYLMYALIASEKLVVSWK